MRWESSLGKRWTWPEGDVARERFPPRDGRETQPQREGKRITKGEGLKVLEGLEGAPLLREEDVKARSRGPSPPGAQGTSHEQSWKNQSVWPVPLTQLESWEVFNYWVWCDFDFF